jgi:hypothetical protein
LFERLVTSARPLPCDDHMPGAEGRPCRRIAVGPEEAIIMDQFANPIWCRRECGSPKRILRGGERIEARPEQGRSAAVTWVEARRKKQGGQEADSGL